MGTVNSSKLSLYLILGIPTIGILLTTLYYFYVVGTGIELGTHNAGELIRPPKNINEISLQKDGEARQWDITSGQWTFLVVGGGQCDEACQEQLYLARQIRLAMGKDLPRIDHVYLNLDEGIDEAMTSLIEDEHPQLKILYADREEALSWFAREEPKMDLLQGISFYLVDPAGWVMMYYHSEHHYRDIISDVKFLVKNS